MICCYLKLMKNKKYYCRNLIFETLLKNAKSFFETMISVLEENCDYDYELNKIDELQTKIKCV